MEDTSKWEQVMNDGMSRVSRFQKHVALSSNEAKYVTITEAGKEMIWMTNYLEELGQKQCKKILCINSRVSYNW